MTRSWNGKSFIDYLGTRLWDSSPSFRENIIIWINEIQNDLATNLPIDHYRFMLKKLLPLDQSLISLKIDKPIAPNAVAASEPVSLLYNTTTALNYTYSTTLIEALEFNFALKLIGVQGDEGLMAKWSTSISANRAIASTTFTAFNGAAVSVGKLDLNNGSNAYVRNTDSSNYAQDGKCCFRQKFTPKFTGSPGATQVIFDLTNNVDVKNSMTLTFTSSQLWGILVASDTGSIINTSFADSGRFTTDVEVELEWNVNIVDGLSELYIDGVLIFAQVNTGTYTPVLPMIGMRIGDSLIGGGAVNKFLVRDFQFFTEPQHTAAFASEIPRVVSTYATSNPSIIDQGNEIKEFADFEAVITEPAGTAVKFIINVNGVDKYHDGAAWVNSTGPTENNTVAEISANANDLISEMSTIKIKVIFENASEESTPTITSVTIYDAGLLEPGLSYKASVTFLVYDDDQDKYMESERGDETVEVVTDADNASIALTNIPLFAGDTTVSPDIIHRRIYLAKKDATTGVYGEPFFSKDIEDNTTQATTILSEPDSEVTPPSDSELDDISADHLFFKSGNRYLVQDTMNRLRRYDPDGSETNSPSYFARYGQDSIELFPKLSISATDQERTLSYYVYRRPHEIFYDVTKVIDIPIQARKALEQGVVWKAYQFRDRSGQDIQQNNYEQFKKELIRKLKRQTGRPAYVRDTQGDTFSREV